MPSHETPGQDTRSNLGALARTLLEARQQLLIDGRPATQQDIAQRLGVPFTYVSRWERGKVRPDIANLTKLAEVYDLDLTELVRLRNATPPPARTTSPDEDGHPVDELWPDEAGGESAEGRAAG
jgi:transcriptional regulator with XRE-family HTH domain